MPRKKTSPSAAPAANANGGNIEVRRDGAKGRIWSQVRQKWLVETPEERVRQEFLPVLVREYGFTLEQITARGETDRVANELFPNDCTPEGTHKTALALYRTFQADPDAFLAVEADA